MNQSRWGLNFICDAPNFDFDKARAIIEKLRPRWIVVINRVDFAKEIAAKYPEVNVIVRWVGDDNDTRKRWPNPSDFIAWANKEFGGARLYANVSNENGFSGDLLKYWIDTIDQSGDLRLAVGGVSVGTPEPADWEQPLALELLRKLDTNRDRVVWIAHEYFPDKPIEGIDGIDGTLTNMAGWPTDVSNRRCWLLGRYQFMAQVCEKNGIQPPRIVIGEFGADMIDQFKAYLQTLIVTPPYSECKGWRSLTNQYRAWYGKDGQLVLLDYAKYADKVIYYHPAIEGIVWFAGCSEQSEWRAFNVLDADDLINGLVPVIEQPPAPARKYEPNTLYVYSGANSFNIRSAPSTVNTITKGKLQKGDTVRFADVDAVSADGHLWQQATVYPAIGGGLEISGWLAVDIIPLAVAPASTGEQELRAIWDRFDAKLTVAKLERDAELKTWQTKYQANVLKLAA